MPGTVPGARGVAESNRPLVRVSPLPSQGNLGPCPRTCLSWHQGHKITGKLNSSQTRPDPDSE